MKWFLLKPFPEKSFKQSKIIAKNHPFGCLWQESFLSIRQLEMERIPKKGRGLGKS